MSDDTSSHVRVSRLYDELLYEIDTHLKKIFKNQHLGTSFLGTLPVRALPP